MSYLSFVSPPNPLKGIDKLAHVQIAGIQLYFNISIHVHATHSVSPSVDSTVLSHRLVGPSIRLLVQIQTKRIFKLHYCLGVGWMTLAPQTALTPKNYYLNELDDSDKRIYPPQPLTPPKLVSHWVGCPWPQVPSTSKYQK